MSGAAAGGGVDSDERGCLGESSVSLLLAMHPPRRRPTAARLFSVRFAYSQYNILEIS